MDSQLRQQLRRRAFWFHKFEFLYYRIGRHLVRLKDPTRFFMMLWTSGKPACNTYFGQDFSFDAQTDIGRQLFFKGVFESAELEVCRRWIKPDAHVVDIGANIGFHSIHFAHWVSSGVIHAIEPSPATMKALRQNTAHVPHVRTHELAISNQSGMSEFFVASDNAYSGFKDTGNKTIRGTIQVKHYTLDAFMEKASLHRVDFIKMDVEGHEQEVIEGMIDCIRKHRPLLFVEISQLQTQNADPEACFQLIVGEGYDAFVLRDDELTPVQHHQPDRHNYFFAPAEKA